VIDDIPRGCLFRTPQRKTNPHLAYLARRLHPISRLYDRSVYRYAYCDLRPVMTVINLRRIREKIWRRFPDGPLAAR
jgi:hypothetical protein